MDEMIVCPFCGEKSGRIESDPSRRRYWWMCANPSCKADGPIAVCEAEARAKWNRRALAVQGLGMVQLASAEQLATGAVEELARFALEGGGA